MKKVVDNIDILRTGNSKLYSNTVYTNFVILITIGSVLYKLLTNICHYAHQELTMLLACTNGPCRGSLRL